MYAVRNMRSLVCHFCKSYVSINCKFRRDLSAAKCLNEVCGNVSLSSSKWSIPLSALNIKSNNFVLNPQFCNKNRANYQRKVNGFCFNQNCLLLPLLNVQGHQLHAEPLSRLGFCRHISSSRQNFKLEGTASSSVLTLKCKTNNKLLDTAQKLDDAKNKLEDAKFRLAGAKVKLEDAKQNLLDDLYDTKARMKERMGEIIERENIMTVPNLLCMLRLATAPVLCGLVLAGNYQYAVALFLCAGITDLADGWIARTFPSQASKLGSFLDPLADKVLVSILFIALTYNGLIPLPLTGLIIYRDVLIITAASYVRYKSLPAPRTLPRYFDASHATVQLTPTTLSKLNTAVQLVLIMATLTQPLLAQPWPNAMTALWFVTTVTTLSSGLGYIFSNDTYKILGDLDKKNKQREEQDLADTKSKAGAVYKNDEES